MSLNIPKEMKALTTKAFRDMIRENASLASRCRAANTIGPSYDLEEVNRLSPLLSESSVALDIEIRNLFQDRQLMFDVAVCASDPNTYLADLRIILGATGDESLEEAALRVAGKRDTGNGFATDPEEKKPLGDVSNGQLGLERSIREYASSWERDVHAVKLRKWDAIQDILNALYYRISYQHAQLKQAHDLAEMDSRRLDRYALAYPDFDPEEPEEPEVQDSETAQLRGLISNLLNHVGHEPECSEAASHEGPSNCDCGLSIRIEEAVSLGVTLPTLDVED